MKRIHPIVALLVLTGFSVLSTPIKAQADKAAADAPQRQKPPPRNLAILIFDGVQIIDYTGPQRNLRSCFVKVLEGGWRPLGRDGDSDHRENTWSVTTNTSAAELFESVNNSIASNKTYGEPSRVKWSRLGGQPTKSGLQSLWQFTDEKGAVWKSVVSVEPITGQENRFMLSVKIACPNA